jgi:hypothetical protein
MNDPEVLWRPELDKENRERRAAQVLSRSSRLFLPPEHPENPAQLLLQTLLLQTSRHAPVLFKLHSRVCIRNSRSLDWVH